MYSLITLYCGYFIYLIKYFRKKELIKKHHKKIFFFTKNYGFDLGVGILLPFIAKNDSEKRIVINSVF
jgi:hypothetical protein